MQDPTFDNAGVGLAHVTTDGKWLRVNAALGEALGYAPDVLAGQSCVDVLHEDHRQAFAQALRDLQQDNASRLEQELQYVGADGKPVWLQCSVTVHAPSNGDEAYVIASFVDITERKVVDQRLADLEDRFEFVAESAGIGYFIWDIVEDRCIYCNEQYAAMHGMTVEQYMNDYATGHADTMIVHPDDRERYFKFVERSLRRREPMACEYRMMRTDGEIRHMLEIESKLEFDGDEATRSEGLLQDITRQYEYLELQQQSAKMQSLGQLAGGLAHDFNNLLAVIGGNAELLMSRLGEEDPMLQAVLHATQRGADLNEKMLAFTHQQSLDQRSLEPTEVIADTLKMIQRTFPASIEVHSDIEADAWDVMADRVLLESALLNLAINARDAMPDGGQLTLRVANHVVSPEAERQQLDLLDGDYVLFEVADDGSGMSEEVRQRAFEPYFTTKPVGEGSGLGLSMVYGFAQQSRGGLEIFNPSEGGSRLLLYLPRAEEKAGQAADSQQAMAEHTHGGQVLVLEDDENIRQLISNVLRKLGYETIEADTAAAAHKALEEAGDVSIIVADVVLPGGTSGPEFVTEVRQQQPDLRVVYVSGYTASELDSSHLDIPGTTFLRKPFFSADLEQALVEVRTV